MSPQRTPRTLAVASATVTVLCGLALPAAGAIATPARHCAPVWYIGARGSGESAKGDYGMGPAVDHMASVISADLAQEGLTMSRLADTYNADSVSDLKPDAGVIADLNHDNVPAATVRYIHTSVDRYDASMGFGIKNAEYAVRTVLADCPGARIVMAGYSQGAVAIHDAENYLAKNRPAEFSHIAGTLLLGDPDRVPHTKAMLFGTSPAAGEGVRVYFKLVKAHDIPAPTTTANIANKNDIVGDFAIGHLLHAAAAIKVHTSYAHPAGGHMVYEKVLDDAANWIASKLTPTDASIRLGNTYFGSLPAGAVTTEHLTATGGKAPYTFRIHNADDRAVPTWVKLSASGTLRISPPARTNATVAFHVYAVDKIGRHSPFTRDIVVFATGSGGAGRLTLDHAKPMLGQAGLTTPVTDCVSSKLCLAVGTGAEVHSYNGTGWTDHYALSGQGVESVSCATTTFCAAVAYNGVYTSTAAGWTNFYPFGADSGLYAACPAAGQCVIVGQSSTSAVSYTLNNGTFGAPVTIAPSLTELGLACASMSFCLVTGESGSHGNEYAATFNGTRWSALTRLAGSAGAGTPSCTAGGACYLESGGKAIRFTATGHVSFGAPADQVLDAISCPSTSSCKASTTSGRVAVYNGTKWTTGPLVDPRSFLVTLSCPTADFCAGQSFEGYTAYFRDSGWSGMKRTDPDGFVSSISCHGTRFCVALDTVGEVSYFNGSTWSNPVMLDPTGNGYQQGSVSCTSSTFCALVDSNGRAFTYNGSRWTRGKSLSPYDVDSVSCASSSMCVAIGLVGDAYMFNGRTWSTAHYTGLTGAGYVAAVSCPSTTFCLAVGGDAAAIYGSGSWRRPVTIAPGTATLHAVDCLSATFCLTGDRESGDLVSYADGSWSKPFDGSPDVDAIACTAAYFCVVAGDEGAVFVSGSAVTILDESGPGSEENLAATCPSSSLCFLGDGNYLDW